LTEKHKLIPFIFKSAVSSTTKAALVLNPKLKIRTLRDKPRVCFRA